eukprot:10492445-Alexandrium_andersonii.AAC.1
MHICKGHNGGLNAPFSNLLLSLSGGAALPHTPAKNSSNACSGGTFRGSGGRQPPSPPGRENRKVLKATLNC